MSTLTQANYLIVVSNIHPSFRWWIEETKTEVPSGTMCGVEGKVEISGLPIPHNSIFSPMGKIFSSVRKRYQEETGLSVAAWFLKNSEIIIGSILPNYATCDDDLEAINKINHDFIELFTRLTALFEEAIDAWLLDQEDGYAAYCQYCEDEVKYDECNEMFNRWLRRANFKTESDEAEKLRRKQATQNRQ